ncbi:heavy metal-binding domain-containing protein [Pelobacter propionicus]|uniref:heavy metal-binding domain-containing protein n=1 Tax=Pelobacter propionicus TaxID=29543 RepID=UPI00059FC4CB|nr:heavy metal-binding domain-containing protein [Pelobacter propionicus]
MDSMQIIVTISGVALIGLTLWFFFGKRSEPSLKDADELYSCPMHPWITSNDPTTDCSICGMKLVRNINEHK